MDTTQGGNMRKRKETEKKTQLWVLQLYCLGPSLQCVVFPVRSGDYGTQTIGGQREGVKETMEESDPRAVRDARDWVDSTPFAWRRTPRHGDSDVLLPVSSQLVDWVLRRRSDETIDLGEALRLSFVVFAALSGFCACSA